MSGWRLAVVLPALVSAAVLWVLGPELLFLDSTPTGGDLGLHVYPYAVGVERILTGASPAGWDWGWFAGFPLFYFYFQLPAVLAAVFTPLFGFAVALKLVVASGLLLLPVPAFLLCRWMGLGPAESSLGAALGSAFVFMESYWHLGGNVYSTVVGEFAYSMSFGLAVLYVAMITRRAARAPTARASADPGAGRELGVQSVLAAAALAGTALSHVLPTILAVVASAPLLLRPGSRRFVLFTWGAGFGISAFWSVPFLVRSPWMGYLRWNIDGALGVAFPEELWLLLPGALVGLVVVRRLGWASVPFLTATGLGLLLFLLPTGLEMRDRLLPFWFFGVHVLAGVGLGRGLVGVVQRRSRWAPVAVGVVGTLVAVLFVVRDVGSLKDFAARSLAGYESQDSWPVYSAFMDSLSALPPGRMVWQTDSVVARFGDYGAPALSPYWSPTHPSLGGLLVESSPSAPFARRLVQEVSPRAPVGPLRGTGQAEHYDLAGALSGLATFGVRYYATFTDEARAAALAAPGYEPRVVADSFAIFEIDSGGLVEVASRIPTVVDGPFEPAAEAWFDRRRRSDEWLVADGPAEWPRRGGAPDEWPPAPETESLGGGVRGVALGRGSIGFATDAIGVPHLVKASWFPNWRAEGADGPWRAAPSLMVVVPRQERVSLEFATTWVEIVGWGTTWITLVVLVGVAVVPLRRERPVPPVPSAPRP